MNTYMHVCFYGVFAVLALFTARPSCEIDIESTRQGYSTASSANASLFHLISHVNLFLISDMCLLFHRPAPSITFSTTRPLSRRRPSVAVAFNPRPIVVYLMHANSNWLARGRIPSQSGYKLASERDFVSPSLTRSLFRSLSGFLSILFLEHFSVINCHH